MRAHVVTAISPQAEALRQVVNAWAKDGSTEVAFVIAPRFEGSADAFEQWASDVGSLDPAFYSAPFHPSPKPGGGTIRLLRRTPDPTVQLVRRTRFADIRSQDPPHYRDIFDLDVGELNGHGAPRTVAASVLARNEQLLAEQRDEVLTILEAIRVDRDEAYARIL